MISIKNTCTLHKHFMLTLPNYWQLKREKKNIILRDSVDYIFKFKNASAFKKSLKINCETNIVIPAQRKLLTKGAITKDLKLYLLQRSAGVQPDRVGKSEKVFDLLEDGQISALRKLAKTSILNKRELDELLLTCIKECTVYTQKFVAKKMSFLIKTKEHHFTDICSYLTLEGLQALLFTFPRFETELHAINIMKATIHNIGQNYIETHTRLKRNFYDTDGKMRIASIYNNDDDSNDSKYINFYAQDSEGLLSTKNENENSSLESDISSVVDKYSGRKLKIINLLKGEYCEDFTKFLNDRNISKYSNDEYFEHAKPDRYIQLIFKFLDYDEQKGYAFIARLKQKLGDYT